MKPSSYFVGDGLADGAGRVKTGSVSVKATQTCPGAKAIGVPSAKVHVVGL